MEGRRRWITPPHPSRLAMLGQDWADVAFLHWPLDPAIAATIVPPGVAVHSLNGETFVGLIALRMRERLPAGDLPLGSWYEQVNVRVYSVDPAGGPGVTFCSLSTGNPIAAAVGPVWGLPYARAAVTVTREGDVLRYSCRRRGARAQFGMRVMEPIPEPSTLDRFVTDRSTAHVRRGRLTWRVDNVHGPWPLHRAELVDFDGSLIAASGLPDPETAPVSVLWSPGVRVTLRLPAPLSGGGRPRRSGSSPPPE